MTKSNHKDNISIVAVAVVVVPEGTAARFL